VALVRPFRGLRPQPEFASKVASPPYDVLSTDEARSMAENNPLSFLRVNKPELEFGSGVSPYSEEVYSRGKENLLKLYHDGTMIRDDQPCFYIYRMTWRGKSQVGLVALGSVDEYDRGIIKKHEHTRPEKVNDRANHIEFLQAQVGPVFITYKQRQSVADVFARIISRAPEVDFTADDDVRHELWVVADPIRVKSLQEAFESVPELYIADGHHRSQAASEVSRRFREANPGSSASDGHNFFLGVIFPDDELQILAYNRAVKDLGNLSIEQLIEKTSGSFEITKSNKPVEPGSPHEFGMYCEGGWYKLVSKVDSYDEKSATGSIDAAILGDNLIAPILGIENPKTDKRIDFVGGIRGTQELVRLVDSGEYKLAFSLYPTSIEQLLKVADACEIMPPKSTWFEPKLRSGMVVNLLTD